jgi:hypothetical protein
LVEWETGETTYEVLDLIASDDPITCAEEAKKQHGLLDIDGWKQIQCIAKNAYTTNSIVNQAKSKIQKREPFWKFGLLEPRTHSQAIELDRKNGNNYWKEGEAKEMNQLLEYNIFIDKGQNNYVFKFRHKKIRCYIVFDINHDGGRKARLVVGGNLPDPNTESVYSGVVSLRGKSLVVFLA